jgi:microcystin-dependent protein
MADPYIGEIRIFANSFAPYGWLECNGQILNIQQYEALYAVIGSVYGGNPPNTFALPKMPGCAPVGAGQGAGLNAQYSLGVNQGKASVALTSSAMLTHSHAVNVTLPQTTSDPIPNPAGTKLDVPITYDASKAKHTAFAGYAASAGTALASSALSVTGNSASHANNQPSLALRFCIASDGIFPVRD